MTTDARFYLALLVTAFLCFGAGVLVNEAMAANTTVQLPPGDTLTIEGCTTSLSLSGNVVTCASPTNVPSSPTNVPSSPTSTATAPAPATFSVTLGEGSGYQDSGDRTITQGQSVLYTCQATTLRIDKLSATKWEPFCVSTTPFESDHETLTCLSGLSESGSGLTRRLSCGTGTPATAVPTASPTTTSQPGPTATPTSTSAPTLTPTATSTPSGSYNPSPCLVINGQSNRIYRDLDINGASCPGENAITITNSSNIQILHVRINGGQRSIYALNSSNIVIDGAIISNPIGPIPEGQCAQYDKVQGGAMRNILCRTTLSSTQPEDQLNAYQSSNIVIEGNDVSGGTSPSGCGIIVDGNLNGNSHHNVIRNNIVRETENCGIAIASGTNHIIEGNTVLGPYGNVGIYVWNQYPGTCSGHIVRNNTVSGSNKFWNGGNCGPIQMSGNNF